MANNRPKFLREVPMQNIPIRTDLGREIKAAFTPEPGVVLTADYAEIELRLAALAPACDHEWKASGDHDLGGNRTEVILREVRNAGRTR
jgi:hypothetical protein